MEFLEQGQEVEMIDVEEESLSETSSFTNSHSEQASVNLGSGPQESRGNAMQEIRKGNGVQESNREFQPIGISEGETSENHQHQQVTDAINSLPAPVQQLLIHLLNGGNSGHTSGNK